MPRAKQQRFSPTLMILVGFLIGVATSAAASGSGASHGLTAAILLYLFAALGALHAIELAQIVTLPLLDETEKKIRRIADGTRRTVRAMRRIGDAIRGRRHETRRRSGRAR